jgi:hypothetical protein
MRKILNRFVLFAPFFVYLVFSLLFFYDPHGNGDIFMPGGDVFSFIWFLNWWPFAISHGINPLLSHYVWSPIGFVMLWSTSIPSLSLLTLPITSFSGPVSSWNFLSLIAPAANATACYYLLRQFKVRTLPAYIGAYLFGFSSYVLGQLLGHINLSFVAIVPIVVMLALARVQNTIKRAWYVVLMSACAIFQFGISTEVEATLAFFGGIAFITFYVFYHDQYDFKGLALDTFYAALASTVILSPALYSLYTGASQVPKIINDPSTYSTDLLNYFIPTPITRLGRSVFGEISARYTGNYSESGAYIGLPLILIASHSLIENKNKKWAPPLFIILASSIIFGFGPFLWINGHKTDLVMPWHFIALAPIIRHALPVRFALYTSLIIAILVVFWLNNESLGKKARLFRYALAIIAVGFLIPNKQSFSWGTVKIPKIFNKTELNRLFGHKPNLIVLPAGYQGNSMLWQEKTGMAFTMSGGYVGFGPNYFNEFPANMYFYGGILPKNIKEFMNNVAAFCGINHVQGIIITSGTNNKLASALEGLPWPRTVVGSSTIIKVPVNLSYLTVMGDFWGGDLSTPQWIGSSVRLINHTNKSAVVTLSRQSAPQSLGKFLINVKTRGSINTYAVGKTSMTFAVPPMTESLIASNKTWSPATAYHTTDTRQLSVSLQVEMSDNGVDHP